MSSLYKWTSYSKVAQSCTTDAENLNVTEHVADLGHVHEAGLKEWTLAVAVQ